MRLALRWIQPRRCGALCVTSFSSNGMIFEGSMQKHKLRLGIVTTYPPGSGSLNEYAFHFVRALAKKHEVAELILFVDELPPGQHYTAHETDCQPTVPATLN